jgi:hypothetical protein
MADLRTVTGRNRRTWLRALRLAILLEAIAWTVPAAIGQVGPESPVAMSPAANPALVPPGVNPAGPAPANSLAAVSPP